MSTLREHLEEIRDCPNDDTTVYAHVNAALKLLGKGSDKRIYKYATGDPIPEGAVYLNTVTQTSASFNYPGEIGGEIGTKWEPCWLVWHYFLVEVES